MRIICVANQKGGVGKTTMVAGLAGALAASGLRVLMVDLDPHASLSHWFGVAAEPPPIGAYELYTAPERSLSELTQATCESGIEVLPAQPALATLERAGGNHAGQARALSRAFCNVDYAADYVLLDCPPTLGMLMVSALAAADFLIIPTQTEPLALRALDGIRRTATMVERSRGRFLPQFIVPTLYDRRTRVGQDCLLDLRSRPNHNVWVEEVPIDTKLREASRHTSTPAAFDARARGAIAFERLACLFSTNDPVLSRAEGHLT
jgi:chromosome partitioning protein